MYLGMLLPCLQNHGIFYLKKKKYYCNYHFYYNLFNTLSLFRNFPLYKRRIVCNIVIWDQHFFFFFFSSAHVMLVLMMIHFLIAGLALDYYDGGKEVSLTLSCYYLPPFLSSFAQFVHVSSSYHYLTAFPLPASLFVFEWMIWAQGTNEEPQSIFFSCVADVLLNGHYGSV